MAPIIMYGMLRAISLERADMDLKPIFFHSGPLCGDVKYDQKCQTQICGSSLGDFSSVSLTYLTMVLLGKIGGKNICILCFELQEGVTEIKIQTHIEKLLELSFI